MVDYWKTQHFSEDLLNQENDNRRIVMKKLIINDKKNNNVVKEGDWIVINFPDCSVCTVKWSVGTTPLQQYSVCVES